MFKRIMWWSLRVILGLVVFWTLVHLLEDWRGKRAWESWKREQELKGAQYEVAVPLSTPLPDLDNFAKAPPVEAALIGRGSLLGNIHFNSPNPSTQGWRVGRALDLKAWAKANNTDDLEANLSEAAKELEDITKAAERKGCRFEVFREGADRASLQILRFRTVGRVLTIRSLIYLRSNRPEAALGDILTQLRIVRHLSAEPNLTTQLVQMATCGFAMQAIWEGLEAHAWNEAQLGTLQAELSQIDELRSFLILGNDERIAYGQYMDAFSSMPWWERSKPFSENVNRVLGHIAIPVGWYYQNRRSGDEYLAETWLSASDPSGHRMRPDRVRDLAHWWDTRGGTPYSVLAKTYLLVGPVMTTQATRFSERQVALDEAMLVCALERYRLAHHAYPEKLEYLVPTYVASLRNDVFSSTPLHYNLAKDGTFQLYSLGWNGTDEGGAMAMDGEQPDYTRGDWPWPHAVAH